MNKPYIMRKITLSILLFLLIVFQITAQKSPTKKVTNRPNFGLDTAAKPFDEDQTLSQIIEREMARIREIYQAKMDSLQNAEQKTARIDRTTTANTVVEDIPQEEKDALKALYDSTNGAGWTNRTGWDFTTPVTSWNEANQTGWYGIIVINGHVTSINLNNNNLTGTIPPAIGKLTALINFMLYSNQLTGTIPTTIETLIQLEYLILSYNQLTGAIPSGIEKLMALKYLSINNNQLTGSIPIEITTLTKLTALHLNSNQLTGTIPAGIGKLTALGGLLISNNKLTGSIPTEIRTLTQLESLFLNNNQLTGSIPAEIGKLAKLKTLFLSANQLSGSIPTTIGTLTQLVNLFISDNQLTGSIPAEIGMLTQLDFLDLSGNKLTGTIPAEITKLTNLTSIYLSNNQLTGSIPTTIGTLAKLKHLLFGNNQLTGSIPAEIATLTQLWYLYLNDNKLSGTIPVSIGKLTALRNLNLENNQLTGAIPAELKNLPFLSLQLQANKFCFIDFGVSEFQYYKTHIGSFGYSPQSDIDEPVTIQEVKGGSIGFKMHDDDRFLPDETYQWYKNGSLIPGATARIYTISTISASDNGTYYCIASHATFTGLTLKRRTIAFQAIDPLPLTILPDLPGTGTGTGTGSGSAAIKPPTNQFTNTKGELQISNSGSATYTLPIALPPSRQNVAPTLNLVYNSSARGGIAGQGWSINSISTISRMATRRDIDGFMDGVDFDDNDKLALDGQRLLLKTGTYWGNGSTYETEYKSNTKIELKTENGGASTYFIVTNPDGSRAWYGATGSGSNQKATAATAWYIVRFEDANTNAIDYNYANASYNNTTQLYINYIDFSGNPMQGVPYQNRVMFNYRNAKRVEKDFVKGNPVYAPLILDNIQVKTNNTLFRKYRIVQTTDNKSGYERVYFVEEINGKGQDSNPAIFEYDTTPETGTRIEKSYTNNLNFSESQAAGDFDGDGRLDFVADNKVFTNLFNGDKGNTPINLPESLPKTDKKIVATTILSNKLTQLQSLVGVNQTDSSIKFKVHNFIGNTFVPSYEKEIPLNNLGTNTGCRNNPYLKKDNEFYEGDFNGDGISEVLIISTVNERSQNGILFNLCDSLRVKPSYDRLQYSIVDLNPNSPIASNGYTTLLNNNIITNDRIKLPKQTEGIARYVTDFNGDGKTDILIFNMDKTYQILSFKQLATAPWVELEIIGSGVLDKYTYVKNIVFGDYNGDGKTDLMMADSEGGSNHTLWHIYYSNPNPAGGEFFVKESYNIMEYWPNSGGYFKTQLHMSSYYAMDVNGDGKSDLVRARRVYYKKKNTINDHDTEWQITAFTNNIGKTSDSGFTLTYESGIFNSGSPDIPIPITSNYRYQGANTDLVLVRGHYNRIEYYQFNKKLDTDNRLKSVTESDGKIKQTIEYKPMEAIGGGLGNPATDFYSSRNTSVYPNIEIIRNASSFLVSKLTATVGGASKSQDFRYHGYTSNFNYGTVGFKRTARSSWYTAATANAKIWAIDNNDENIKGANTLTWTSTNGSTVFESTPSNILSTKTNVFATYTDPTTKRYNVLLNQQTTIDAITGVKSEKTFTYDGLVDSGSSYGLQTQTVTRQFNGTTLQGTTTTTTQYDNNPSGVGNAYYIGRPNSVNTTAALYTGDTRSSSETYTYTGANLTKTEKTGHNTAYPMVEEMTYDNVGNLLTKKVSAPAAPVVIAPRIITDEYDPTKRFVIKKTDPQGFVTTFIYSDLGQVKQSINYLGVKSEFVFDDWGKLTTSTTTNTSTTPLVTNTTYAKLTDGGYTVTSTNNTDQKTVVKYDVLGRTTINSTKRLDTGTMVSKQIVYDALGRKQKESEPYFTSPTQWTAYEYDYLQRPVKITAPTGKIQTFSYAGLTTTSNDNGKITNVTVDALGNKTQTTDPGGTVNFVYYANGQLKESDYGGNKITIAIDGWGNKIATTDPNAGTYTSTYDAFGQIKTETTPNGTTSYTYDDYGKVTEKTIVGTNTNSKTVYIYDANNLLTTTTFTNVLEGNAITNNYEYDSYKRLTKTTETTPYAVFTKQLTYDAYGRVEKATSTATAAGKSSSKTIKNTYKNGFPWQILDDATQQVLWQTNTVNERGQLLTATLGNGIAITNQYDAYGFAKQIKHDKTGALPGNVITLNTVFDPKKENLSSRSNSMFNWNETFTYDTLDRLLTYNNAQGQPITQNYDDRGRITQNTIGTYSYDATDKLYQNTAVELTPEAEGYYRDREGALSDGMEDKQGWGISKFPGTDFFSYDDTKSHTGKIALKLSNPNETEQYLHANKWVTISNAGETEYTYSVWVYTDNPEAELFLFMKAGAQASYPANSVTTKTTNQWVHLEGTFKVPANVTQLNLRLDNNGQGTIWFDDVQLRKTSNPDTSIRQLNITYNTFKSPIQIEETGVDKISFTYNDDNSRSAIFYGSLEDDKLQRPYRKYYSADGSMEIKHNIISGTMEFVSYIGGDGYSAPIVLKSDGTTQNYLYLHRDYQGSILAITDATGAVLEKRLFDAWGAIVKVQDGAGNILNGLTILDRGYTGHEHLQSVGLIHMNGRLYDPKLHRFLQPDNFVQQPENTQNYNRYGYCWNNPLRYTDPSGEEIVTAILIGAAIAALTYTMTALLADVPFSVGGLAKAVFIGAASAAVTFGIGTAADNLCATFLTKATFQAVAHGTFQGAVTAVSGGKFWSGFASGALSSIAASAWSGGKTGEWQGIGGKFADNGAGMIAFGTVAGGVGAQLTGGNFWQGAATGFIVSTLNHTFHDTDPPGKKKTKNDVRKETVKPSLAKLLEVEGNTLGVIELIRDSPIGEFVRGNASSINKAVSNGLKTTGNVFSGAGIVFEAVEVGQGNMSWTEFGVDSTISAAAIFTSYVTVTVAGASVAPFVAGGALIYFGGKAIYEYSSGNTLFTKPTK